MKTKPPEPISTAFPTCGEVFYFVINALNLPAWADAFHESASKRRELANVKAQSDQLRDWATEVEGRAPRRGELEQFIRNHVRGLPQEAALAFILCNTWANLLDEHVDVVAENTTYLDPKGTRRWYAVAQAPRALFFLWVLQKLLARLDQSKGSILNTALDVLLHAVMLGSGDAQPKHPLHRDCYRHYADLRAGGVALVDPKTIAAWKSGEDRPSFDALGRHFSETPDKLGLLLNFAFASLVEGAANALRYWIPEKNWTEGCKLLIRQARCIHTLDEGVAKAEARTPNLSLSDYGRLLGHSLRTYMEFLEKLEDAGVGALDLRVAKFQAYQEYQRTVANLKVPPGFDKFLLRLNDLWKNTALQAAGITLPLAEVELAMLRANHPDWSAAFAGQILAIEARLMLCQDPPTAQSLQTAFNLYQEAFSAARYRAGMYTTSILREALGLGAMLHRRETGDGSIKPWMKKVLGWWDLLGLGPEFDHEKLEQRVEIAESRFTDSLAPHLRERLQAALPKLGLRHWNVNGLFGFVEPGLVEEFSARPVDMRQKKPMSQTIVGRDQTALMEAIDRGQLHLARKLVSKGADLNFINSTGDTCVTKAFARNDHDLVLQILRRDHNPIRSETLLRVTEKMRISGLEQAISTGQVEILREMAKWKDGRGDLIDLSKERIWGQTPLYYAISCLVHFRMNVEDALSQMPKSVTDLLRPDTLQMVQQHFAKEQNPEGVLNCIQFLINEAHVDIDEANTGDNTALTYAAERRLHDVAAMLLAAGANVNHRFLGNGTALVRAIINDDYEMARLLIEYKADYRLQVGSPAIRIYEIPMSERMRELIPLQS